MAVFKRGELALASADMVVKKKNDKVQAIIPKGAEFHVLDINYCCEGQLILIDLNTGEVEKFWCHKCNKLLDATIYTWAPASLFDKPEEAKNAIPRMELIPKTEEVVEKFKEIINPN